MKLTSTETRYGVVAIVLHWVIAILITLALISGFAADALGRDGLGALRAHIVCGALAGILTLVRILWWAIADRKPDPVDTTTGWQSRLAGLVHILLIVVPLGMLASGVGMLILTGSGPQILSGTLTALPDFEAVAPRGPHGLGARLLIALIGVHIAAALYHHYVLGDRLIRRMTA